MVVFNSEKTLSRISWQLVQNFSVLVNSSAVLNAPQNMMPHTKPPNARNARLKCVLGWIAISQNQKSNAFNRVMTPSLLGSREQHHVLEGVWNGRLDAILDDMAGGAEVSA